MSIYLKEWDLNLESDTFNALKTDFNQVLRKTLSNMETKSSEFAELTVKLKITLTKENAPGYDLPRDIVVPKFDHKVSSVMQIKTELTGSLGGEYELVWDAARGEYIMREIADPQQSIFDYGYETAERGDIIDVDTQPADDDSPTLPGGKAAGLLPDKSEANDGCFTDYPDCLCLTCVHLDDEDENVSCCGNHARDCGDTTDCIDYKKARADYEYDEPTEEGAEDE